MSEILKFNNVSFAYENGKNVLENLSFSVHCGESIGLIGANGTGKSTLMKLMLGLLMPDEGSISVCGMELNKKNLRDIRQKVGFVFQDSDNQLFMHTVYRDICFGPQNYGYSKEEVEKRAERAMELTGCTELKDKAVYKLSGGEKKLASIATILSMEPEVIVLDEPENSLDPANRRRLISILKELPGTKIIASHDLDFIWETTDRVLLLGDKKVAAYDGVKEILKDEYLLNRYSLEVPGCAIIEELRNRR